MKFISIFKKSLLAFLIMGVTAASSPIEVLVPISDVFSPKGFDSNDNSQIIVSGYLPNLCHKAPMSEVKVVNGKVEIKVKSLRYDASNPYCPEVIVPFVEAIDLGVMDKGFYDIVVNGKSIYELRERLQVNEASSGAVDEHIYAGVEFIEKSEGSNRIFLKGYNPSDCFVLDEIEVFDNAKNVYSVLPKLKQISDFCALKMVPFEYEMEVPNNLKADRILLHVRSVQGKSINSIFLNSQSR